MCIINKSFIVITNISFTLQEFVEGLSPDSVTGIDFSCNGYCTDAVLRTIAQYAKVSAFFKTK